MWFPRLMYSEAYYWACTVDEDKAQLILQAYNSDEIDFETAERLFWEIVAQTVDPSSNSESIQ